MRIRNLAILAGATAIAAAPLAAQQARTTAPVAAEEEIGGVSGIAGAALGVAIGAAIIFAFVELTEDDEPDAPISA